MEAETEDIQEDWNDRFLRQSKLNYIIIYWVQRIK